MGTAERYANQTFVPGKGNEGKEHREKEAEHAAKHEVKGSPESDGPHVIGGAADEMLSGMIPQDPAIHHGDPELRYLQGRIALSKPEVALALGTTVYSVEQMQKRGELPAVKLGGRYYFPLKAIERHLEALAYATSGALDQWEQALADATANRLRTARRRAYERRQALQARLKRIQKKRKRALESPHEVSRDEAKQIVSSLWAAHEDLDAEQRLVTSEGEKLRSNIAELMDTFDIEESEFTD